MIRRDQDGSWVSLLAGNDKPDAMSFRAASRLGSQGYSSSPRESCAEVQRGVYRRTLCALESSYMAMAFPHRSEIIVLPRGPTLVLSRLVVTRSTGYGTLN